MLFRSLDKNWDWQWARGVADYSQNAMAISYDIKTKILSWYGDCFFAMNEGIDWKNILGSKDQKNRLDNAIKQIIQDEEGVTEITYFESGIEDRKYTCTAKIKTIYNETIEVKI